MVKEIAFRTEYSGSYEVENLDINLTKQDIINIKKAQEIVKANNFISNIRIDVLGSVVYLDEDGNDIYLKDEEEEEEEVGKWRVDVEQFIVYNNTFYYYAQSKYDSGDYIESDELYLEDFE